MKLEIILALVLVTTICSGHTLRRREADTEADVETTAEGDTKADVDTNVDVDSTADIDSTAQVDVEDTNDENYEPEKVVKAVDEGQNEQSVDEGQGQNEQSVDVEQPKLTPEDKRGMDVAFMSKPEVCTGWIEDFFDEYLVLSEDRAAVFSDLQRFFIFMDDDGDAKISEEEFEPKWTEATGFSELDTLSLFYTFFVMVGDPKDENHIEPSNVQGIWEELFMTDTVGGELPKDIFSETWQEILLPALPQHGCSGVNYKSGDSVDSDGLTENTQIRPDVYGYYKRK